jgi:hypothetical protein
VKQLPGRALSSNANQNVSTSSSSPASSSSSSASSSASSSPSSVPGDVASLLAERDVAVQLSTGRLFEMRTIVRVCCCCCCCFFVQVSPMLNNNARGCRLCSRRLACRRCCFARRSRTPTRPTTTLTTTRTTPTASTRVAAGCSHYASSSVSTWLAFWIFTLLNVDRRTSSVGESDAARKRMATKPADPNAHRDLVTGGISRYAHHIASHRSILTKSFVRYVLTTSISLHLSVDA